MLPVAFVAAGSFVFIGMSDCCSWTNYVLVRTVAGVDPSDVIDAVVSAFPGLAPKSSWGETSLFYNPDGVLPHGVYFATLKEQDGATTRLPALTGPVCSGSPLACQQVGTKHFSVHVPLGPQRGVAWPPGMTSLRSTS